MNYGDEFIKDLIVKMKKQNGLVKSKAIRSSEVIIYFKLVQRVLASRFILGKYHLDNGLFVYPIGMLRLFLVILEICFLMLSDAGFKMNRGV